MPPTTLNSEEPIIAIRRERFYVAVNIGAAA